VDVRKVWTKEDTDFTPWLANEENIALLGKAVGLELEVEQVEASVGPYSADILAKDIGTDKYVIIENQLGKTNHDHLGKVITYGSVLDASAVIWIASEFTEEHHRALDWLNEFTTDELSFYGVLLEIWQIDESRPAVRFNVISRPTEIKRGDVTGKTNEDLSDARKLQLEFWTAFRESLLKSKIVTNAQKPRPQYWFDVPLGKTNINLSNIANTYENRIGVRVYIGNKIADWALPQLETQKEEIEAEIGTKLVWNPNPENRDKTIAVFRDLNLQHQEEWDTAIAWMVDMVKQFRKVFMPRVKILKEIQ
ncbi:DUF4268 domain-containing protein, partial [Candidatus Omnitrophota bacterium]